MRDSSDSLRLGKHCTRRGQIFMEDHPRGARSQQRGRQSPVPEEVSAPWLSQRRRGPARARSSLQTLATHSQRRQNCTSKSVFETRVKPDPRGKRSPGEVQFSHRNCISTGKFLLAQTAGSGINTSKPAKRQQSIRSWVSKSPKENNA